VLRTTSDCDRVWNREECSSGRAVPAGPISDEHNCVGAAMMPGITVFPRRSRARRFRAKGGLLPHSSETAVLDQCCETDALPGSIVGFLALIMLRSAAIGRICAGGDCASIRAGD